VESGDGNAPAGARPCRHFCLRAERGSGGGQEPARSARGSGLVVCGGQCWGYRSRPANRPGAACGDQRLALCGGSLLAGIVSFWWTSVIDRLRSPVLLFDAVGLGLFAVTGTQKALAFGLNPIMAALLGMLTGIGGGRLAMSSWPRFRPCCAPIFTPPPPWPARLWW
jgi:hypothetical protein